MWPPRRPLLGLALVQIAALAAGFHFPLPLALTFGLGAGLALAGLLLYRRTSSLPCLYLGWICWCLAAARWTVADPSPAALARQAPPVPVTVELRAVLTDDPVAYAGARTDRLQWIFPAAARELKLAGTWRGVRGPVRVYWRARAGDIQPACGDRWRFRGELYPPRAPAAPGATWVLRAAAGAREAHGSGLRAWAYRGRAWCADCLGLGLETHPDAAGLLRAMLLGLRQELTPDWREAFATTGTLHVFAISGLHVGVLALLVTLVLKLFGISRMHWFWWLAPLLILYTLGTGLKTSALRATLMALIYFAGLSLGRRPDPTNSLALAALLILGWAPAQLHDVGFQLSFVVVGGLSAWYGPIRRRLPSGRIRDPLKIGPETRWEHGAHQALRYFWGLVAASFAAWLASWPLVAYHFNLISPSGLLGNLLVVPASFVIVLTGLLALLTGLLFPLLAAVFNTANSVVIAGLLALIEALQRVPGSYLFVAAPPLATLVGWYALLALARGPRWRGRPLALLLAAALAAAGPLAAWRSGHVPLDILDVGHGHCALLTPP
ncbi:MAG: ComEC family competence protein, partial [Candidatus Marinimicrobia bacterium]|nr:ComEC family competence protein [Candidatus Neomarinimicrobiota bacterium]